ncbi:MAG: tetratricopeptide repeat protein [Sedimentisphaerales bacterium]|nr:tetratricopeptide repeat protein [Sedimentisphaerales bacterium]
MTGQNDTAKISKAKAFFQKARKIAETRNFDYAINMYLEGLNYGPDSVQTGHIPLRKLALLRQTGGGKKPSIAERIKHMRGKTALEQMLNAEYLFAKDPEHLPYAEAILKAAVAGSYKNTAKWIADLVFAANNASHRPSVQTYVLLKDSYAAIGQFQRAIAACQCATRLKPQDPELADEFKRLSAELAVSQGGYDQEGDFRHSIKNRESQERLHAQQKVVKTLDYRVAAVEEARKAIGIDATSNQHIYGLADALSDLQTDKGDSEAIELLEDTYESKGDFGFKQRAGQLKIKHFQRKVRQAKAALEKDPDNDQLKSNLAKSTAKLNQTELEHFGLCVENYPTDLRAKYEYAVRLIINRRFDEAIPLLQQAQKDPRHKFASMSKIGFCFFMKGWLADAIDVFTRAISGHESGEDGLAKELHYYLGRCYEQQAESAKALEIYRKIAQVDFAYKDVRLRIDRLRDKQ